MVRIPLCCICCGSVDGVMDGCSGEEIQAESSRLHVLVATVVVMNFEPWREITIITLWREEKHFR
jgi:hypothetical protein